MYSNSLHLRPGEPNGLLQLAHAKLMGIENRARNNGVALTGIDLVWVEDDTKVYLAFIPRSKKIYPKAVFRPIKVLSNKKDMIGLLNSKNAVRDLVNAYGDRFFVKVKKGDELERRTIISAFQDNFFDADNAITRLASDVKEANRVGDAS